MISVFSRCDIILTIGNKLMEFLNIIDINRLLLFYNGKHIIIGITASDNFKGFLKRMSAYSDPIPKKNFSFTKR